MTSDKARLVPALKPRRYQTHPVVRKFLASAPTCYGFDRRQKQELTGHFPGWARLEHRSGELTHAAPANPSATNEPSKSEKKASARRPGDSNASRDKGTCSDSKLASSRPVSTQRLVVFNFAGYLSSAAGALPRSRDSHGCGPLNPNSKPPTESFRTGQAGLLEIIYPSQCKLPSASLRSGTDTDQYDRPGPRGAGACKHYQRWPPPPLKALRTRDRCVLTSR
jgi:hypothetical protein